MVYQGRDWKRTVITFNDIFFADPAISADQFEPHLRRLGQNQIRLAEEDLDRLSTYFRELQEYVSIDDAINEANPGDIILYDGSFDVFEPLRAALSRIFERAEEKEVASWRWPSPVRSIGARAYRFLSCTIQIRQEA